MTNGEPSETILLQLLAASDHRGKQLNILV